MDAQALTRRHLLRTSGLAALSGFAGCTSSRGNPEQSNSSPPGSAPTTTDQAALDETSPSETVAENRTGPHNGDDLPPDDDSTDGYPPQFDEVPGRATADSSAFATMTVEGTTVPLVPIDVAYRWYAHREARFADARGETAYDHSHVFGAVLSPAPDGRSSDDAVAGWPTGDRIVTYCACPHHLSSMRAARLIEQGYEKVYALDEGFLEWKGRDYPMAGTSVNARIRTWKVRGRVPDEYGGATAWAFHEPSGQREATQVHSDGTFVLELPFVDVTGESIVTVKTPAYTVEKPLRELAAGVVTAASK